MDWRDLSTRRGTFILNRHFIEHNPELVFKVMAHCIITKVDAEFTRITYEALSPLFEPLMIAADTAPMYRVRVTLNGEVSFW